MISCGGGLYCCGDNDLKTCSCSSGIGTINLGQGSPQAIIVTYASVITTTGSLFPLTSLTTPSSVLSGIAPIQVSDVSVATTSSIQRTAALTTSSSVSPLQSSSSSQRTSLAPSSSVASSLMPVTSGISNQQSPTEQSAAPPSTAPIQTDIRSGSTDLGKGELAGIIIGSIVRAAFLVALLYLLITCLLARRKGRDSDGTTPIRHAQLPPGYSSSPRMNPREVPANNSHKSQSHLNAAIPVSMPTNSGGMYQAHRETS